MRVKNENNKTLSEITENSFLNHWGRMLSRHPDQFNGLHEADAELLPIGDGSTVLASTVDTVAEEIATGLYRNPETIGWVAAMASLSDLAAVGATPLGVLSSVSMPSLSATGFMEGVGKGLEKACRYSGTFVLGGDTNQSTCPSVTVCALGTVAKELMMTRLGLKTGDLIYSSGPLGAGAAYAARVLLQKDSVTTIESTFNPVARLREGTLASPFASACMDTSDGLLATLDQLSRLNSVRIDISTMLDDLLTVSALEVKRELHIPALALLAAQHGEFELVFGIPEKRESEFLTSANRAGFLPIKIGRVHQGSGVSLLGNLLPTAQFRNLQEQTNGDVQSYVKELLRLTASLRDGE